MFFGAGVSAVLLLERRPASPPPAARPTEAAPAATPSIPSAVAPPSVGPPPTTASTAPAAVSLRPDRQPPLPLDMAARKRALGPLRDEVFAALSTLDARVARCGTPPMSLVLTLETLERGVHVVDVQVTGRDAAETEGVAAPPEETPETIACVRSALAGELLAAPSARPGRRWEMAYVPGAR